MFNYIVVPQYWTLNLPKKIYIFKDSWYNFTSILKEAGNITDLVTDLRAFFSQFLNLKHEN